jgi:hypothetical protein
LPKRLIFSLLLITVVSCFFIYLIVHFAGGKLPLDEPGKTLAKRHCQSCHQLPDPSLLSKERWQNSVLPVMGLYLGVTPLNGVEPTPIEDSLFPDKALLNEEEWTVLQSYYLQNAPDELPQSIKPSVISYLRAFSLITPRDSAFFSTSSITSFVHIDTTVNPHRLLVANSRGKQLFVLNKKLDLEKSFGLPGPLVNLLQKRDRTLGCIIGDDIMANDLNVGSVMAIGNPEDTFFQVIFPRLARPVQIEQVDLDNDNLEDYIVCQFGNLKGELTWMRNNGNNAFEKHSLSPLAGATHVVVHDSNEDGRMDLWVLFSQGGERIQLFLNKGNGKFEIKTVLEFPPSYGSSYFELVDVNNDRFLDIVYTCGDNGDYSRILKPYHGIYIFLSDKEKRFKMAKFLPVNGCYKALARDFDEDGDLDIASISYFPAKATPWEAFIYFENNGGLNFKPYSLPSHVRFQRGLTMDAGDLNSDGKLDIILGNGYYTSDSLNGIKEPLFIVLQKE